MPYLAFDGTIYRGDRIGNDMVVPECPSEFHTFDRISNEWKLTDKEGAKKAIESKYEPLFDENYKKYVMAQMDMNEEEMQILIAERTELKAQKQLELNAIDPV